MARSLLYKRWKHCILNKELAMKKLIAIVIFTLTLLPLSLFAEYCTQKNFNTGDEVYNQAATSHNKVIKTLNPLIDAYNQEEFAHRTYSKEQLLDAMVNSSGSVVTSFNLHQATIKAQLAELKRMKEQISYSAKRAPTAISLWEKLAKYCRDEAERDNARMADKNAVAAEGLNQRIDQNVKKIERMIDAYQSESDYLTAVKALYQRHLDCQ